MGEHLELTASDGHKLGAYRALPDGRASGGVVVVQEIFGVNSHVRSVCDGFAADGFAAIAPALFDRKERDVELDYDEAGIAAGRELAFPLGWDGPMRDIGAAAEALAERGKVGVVGYCWGGSLAYLSACRLDIACAVGYYGGQITKILEANPGDTPRVPTILHFGRKDAAIPLDDVETIRKANPDVPIHLYDAGHGFNCDRRGSWDEESAKLARERTIAFFEHHLRA